MFRNEPAEERFQQAKRISELMNLGPMAEKHFSSAGIITVSQFRKLGWQRTMKRLVTNNPKHRHSLYAYAIIGALKNIMWNRIPEKDKAEARAYCASLKPQSKTKPREKYKKK